MGFSTNDPRNYFALAKQTSAEAEATTGFKFVKYLNGTALDIAIDSQSIYEGGDGMDQGLIYRQHTKPDGQIQAYVRPDMWTYLSAWTLGSAAAVGTSAEVGTSVYVPNSTSLYLTVEAAWGGGNQADRVISALLTGMTVEGQSGEPWKVTVPFIGGGTPYYRDGAASGLAPTLETGDPAMYAGGAYLLNGATEVDVMQWTYNYTRNVDDNLFTTSTFRRKVVPLSRSVSLEMQIIWQNQAYYKQIQYGGGSYVPAFLATGSFHAERQLVGSQLIAIDVPNLRFTNVSVNRLNPDGETVVLDVSAMGIRAGTSLVQHRSVHNAVTASSYLGPSGI
jgi:hypothetical protein